MKYKKIFLLLPLLFLILVPSVYAASSSFITNAQKWYTSECTRRPDKVKGENAIMCFVFDKLSELETRLNSSDQKIEELENSLSSQDQKINDLENKVTVLESSQPHDPLDITFFNDVPILTSSSQSSDWYDSENYSELVFTYQCKAYTATSEYGAEVILVVSNDKTTSANVFTASKAECHSGGTITVDVAGKYYKVIVGNNSNIVSPPMTIFAMGRFR